MLRTLPDALPVGALNAKHRRWLSALPASREYTTAHGKLLLCHGLGDDDMVSVRPDDMVTFRTLRDAEVKRFVMT